MLFASVQLLPSLSRLRVQSGSVELLSASPQTPSHLVFTLTHLYPSTSVLEDVSRSLVKVIERVPSKLTTDYWGNGRQVASVYGRYNPILVSKTVVEDEIDSEDVEGEAVGRELQTKLLNACYSRQHLLIAGVKLEFVHSDDREAEILLEPIEVKLIHRRLLYPASW